MAFDTNDFTLNGVSTGVHSYSTGDSLAQLLTTDYFSSVAASLAAGDSILVTRKLFVDAAGVTTNQSMDRFMLSVNFDKSISVPGTSIINAEVVTTTNVITPTESGKTFFLNSATEFVSTLPAPALGLKYTFVVTAAPSGASYTIVTTSSSNTIKGQIYTVDVNSATDTDFETSGGDTITLVDGKAVAGDRVEVVSDGTNWFAYGFCSVFDAITITTAS